MLPKFMDGKIMNKIYDVIEISLIDENENFTDVQFDCEFEVEPKEIVGGYEFYQGGFTLIDFTTKPFTFKGIEYNYIIPELYKYIDWSYVRNEKWYRQYVEPAIENETPISVGDFITLVEILALNKVEGRDIDIPVKYYPFGK